MAVNYITAKLNTDKTLVFDQTAEVNSGENLSTQLQISVPSSFADFNFNLEFLLPDDKKYATGFIPLHLTVDEQYILNYTPDRSLLSKRGRVYVQVRGSKTDDTNTTEVFKSVKSADASFEVNPSIFDAKEPFVYRDVLTDICETLNQAQTLLDKIQTDINNGLAGKDGITPEISANATTLPADQQATVTKSGTTEAPVFTFGIPKGEKGDKGDKGVSIISITKTNTDSLIDTYTITYSDNTQETFKITNGKQGETGLTGDKGENGVTFTPSINSDGILIWTRSDNGADIPSPTPVIPKIGLNGNWFLGETDLNVSAKGSTGDKGDKGITFTPSLDDSGNLSWSNDGGLTNPTTVNIKGARGYSGTDGVTYTPYLDEEGLLNWSRSDGNIDEVPSPTPIIPQIGENGNWFLGETDLEVSASGETGPQGEAGANGTTFTPSVDSAGNLSWSNNGGLSNPSTVNLKGLQGAQGYGIVNITTPTTLEYGEMQLEEIMNTTVTIETNEEVLKVGDTLICPYFNLDSYTMKVFAGKITNFDPASKEVTFIAKWYLS